MAKVKNIDHIFKEGLEAYKAKPDHDLEARMAAMIGITGTAIATGTTAATTATTGTAAAGLGTAAVVSKGGLMAKCTAMIKLAALKGTAFLKALGVIKTIGTIVVIGAATTAAVMVSDEMIENKPQTEIAPDTPQTQQVASFGVSSIQSLEMEQRNSWLSSKEMAHAQQLFLVEECRDAIAISQLEAQEYYALEYENQATYLLTKEDLTPESSFEKESMTASSATVSSNTLALKETSLKSVIGEEALVEEDQLPEEILPQAARELEFIPYDPSFLSIEGMKLKAPPLMVPKMNSLEKGFYLPNYKIHAEFSVMPMMFTHLLKPKIHNDTITASQVSQNPQLSYQIGAALRIQKKRKPWFLQAGLNYQHLKEEVDLYFKREFIDQEQGHWDIDTVYNYFINPPVIDSNIQSIDSAFMALLVKSEEGQKATNTYQFLEVPLRLGYQYHKYGKNWSVEASTGVSFAFHLKSSGYIYNDAGNIIDYQDTKSRPQVYCYYLAHLGFNYHLNSMTLFAEPSLKYQLNKKKVENSPYESRYLLYGLKLGIRIQLFKNGGQP